MKLAASLFAAVLPLAAAAAPENYTVDPIHSFANFSIDHLGFTTIYGRFDKSAGKFAIDLAAKTGSVEFTVETASVTTGDSDRGGRPRSRDDHLKSADFFNVAEFPRMSFRSTGAKFSGEDVAEIEGQLTLIGATKPLVFKAERWKCAPHPFSKKEMCGGNFIGSLKRSDFGMKFGIPAIGDEIRLTIGFEAYKD